MRDIALAGLVGFILGLIIGVIVTDAAIGARVVCEERKLHKLKEASKKAEEDAREKIERLECLSRSFQSEAASSRAQAILADQASRREKDRADKLGKQLADEVQKRIDMAKWFANYEDVIEYTAKAAKIVGSRGESSADYPCD